MPHIDLPEGVPGILGPMAFRPATARPLGALAEVLLRADHSLSRGERELIAAYVSHLNGCTFCERSHTTFAVLQLGEDAERLAAAVIDDPERAPVSPKFRALLAIAAQVQQGGLAVTDAHVARARVEGASDVEIHDTVLIAAAFCMYNRYVDGLATWAPEDQAAYDTAGRAIVDLGYAVLAG